MAYSGLDESHIASCWPEENWKPKPRPPCVIEEISPEQRKVLLQAIEDFKMTPDEEAKPTTSAVTIGRKDDTEKPRWNLLPYDTLKEVVDVFTLGAHKYGDFNWQLVSDPHARYFSALMRHLTGWWNGETKDPETHKHHLAHATCCLLILLWHDTRSTVRKDPS